LIKYIKSVLWRVAKRLSYIEDARCLKVNFFSVFQSFLLHSRLSRIDIMMCFEPGALTLLFLFTIKPKHTLLYDINVSYSNSLAACNCPINCPIKRGWGYVKTQLIGSLVYCVYGDYMFRPLCWAIIRSQDV